MAALKGLLQLLFQNRWSAEQALSCPFFSNPRPRSGTLANREECKQILDQTNAALDNEDILQLMCKFGAGSGSDQIEN